MTKSNIPYEFPLSAEHLINYSNKTADINNYKNYYWTIHEKKLSLILFLCLGFLILEVLANTNILQMVWDYTAIELIKLFWGFFI